ncbi:MAG: riboflavin synthase [Bacteroidetes bacterium]|nr:riboflavin synthase [Bacteroidota bacterium]
MFTGIIEEIGVISSFTKKADHTSIEIEAMKVLTDVQLGDSIAVNGVCLTVVSFTKASFKADVMNETIKSSTLKALQGGDHVNLERAATLGSRLGGHLVSGHVDGTGVIRDIQKDDNAMLISIEPDQKLMKYMILKGSIALDGISLTIQHLELKVFTVSVIHHTLESTNLGQKKIGDSLNIEVDQIAKYTERLLGLKNDETRKEIKMNDLNKYGFI